jgi:predicted RNase H-like HicB family nuclease
MPRLVWEAGAVVPDLLGYLALGTTPEAAVHEIGDAIEAWIAACRASGDPVPEPTTKNARTKGVQAPFHPPT